MQICIARTCYGNVAGWMSVTRQYCINTTKPILKPFRPFGSPIILVSSDPFADTKFPFSRGYKYTRVGNIGDFRRKSPFISKRCEIGQ